MSKIIVTNLRLPEEEYEIVREAAHEARMSINSYVREIIKKSEYALPELLALERKTFTKKPEGFYDAMRLISQIAKEKHKDNKPKMSPDDQAIYDL